MLTQRQQARLNYLLKYRPSDPQVAELQRMSGGGQPTSANNIQTQNSVNAPVGAAAPQQSAPAATSGTPLVSGGNLTQTMGNLSSSAFGAPMAAAPQQPTSLDVTAKNTPRTAAATAAPVFTKRQSDRLNFLLKHRPSDPDVKKLQALKEAAGSQVSTPTQVGATADKTPDPGDAGLGNTATEIDNFLEGVFGDPSVSNLDLNGQPKVLSSDDITTQRKQIYDASYADQTKNLDRDQARQLEQQKQELADRGIPYTPGDPNSGYGKAIQGINEQFQGYRQTAENNAQLTADQRLSTLVTANKEASDQFLQSALARFNARLNSAATATNALDVLMKKYGLTQQAAQAKLDRAKEERLAKMAAQNNIDVARIRSASGGSSGASSTDDQFIG